MSSKADLAWIRKMRQKADKTLAQKAKTVQAKTKKDLIDKAIKLAETPPKPETKPETTNGNDNSGKQ